MVKAEKKHIFHRFIRRPLIRFGRDNSGASALEFSILVIPFIMIMFATLETSLSFTSQQLMQNSVDKVARQVRTGQVKLATTDQAAFRALICEDLSLLVGNNCPEMEFDLKSYGSYSLVPTTIPFTPSKQLDTAGFTYNPGGSSTINHLRVFYRWPVITDFMKSKLSGLDDGKILLYASATWKNEPY